MEKIPSFLHGTFELPGGGCLKIDEVKIIHCVNGGCNYLGSGLWGSERSGYIEVRFFYYPINRLLKIMDQYHFALKYYHLTEEMIGERG